MFTFYWNSHSLFGHHFGHFGSFHCVDFWFFVKFHQFSFLFGYSWIRLRFHSHLDFLIVSHRLLFISAVAYRINAFASALLLVRLLGYVVRLIDWFYHFIAAGFGYLISFHYFLFAGSLLISLRFFMRAFLLLLLFSFTCFGRFAIFMGFY